MQIFTKKEQSNLSTNQLFTDMRSKNNFSRVAVGLAIIFFCTILAWVGCKKEKGDETTIELESVEFLSENLPENNRMEEGESQKFYVQILPESMDTAAVYWNSSNKNVASVDSKGRVYALREGTTTISATVLDKTIEVQIEVIKVQIKSIYLPDTFKIRYNQTDSLPIGLNPDVASFCSIDLTSENAEIATITQKEEDCSFQVTGAKAGTARIVASFKNIDGEKIKKECIVEVWKKAINAFNLDKTTMNMFPDKTADLTATLDIAESDYTINSLWDEAIIKSSDTNIATITKKEKKDGSIVFSINSKEEGTATITITLGGVTETCTVTVKQTYPSSISIWVKNEYNNEIHNATLTKEDTVNIFFSPGNLTDLYGLELSNVIWSSSNSSVAKINSISTNADGNLYCNVVGLADGTATITATLNRGKSQALTATFEIVVDNSLKSITLSNDKIEDSSKSGIIGTLSIRRGETEKITYTINPTKADVSNLSLNFESIPTTDELKTYGSAYGVIDYTINKPANTITITGRNVGECKIALSCGTYTTDVLLIKVYDDSFVDFGLPSGALWGANALHLYKSCYQVVQSLGLESGETYSFKCTYNDDPVTKGYQYKFRNTCTPSFSDFMEILSNTYCKVYGSISFDSSTEYYAIYKKGDKEKYVLLKGPFNMNSQFGTISPMYFSSDIIYTITNSKSGSDEYIDYKYIQYYAKITNSGQFGVGGIHTIKYETKRKLKGQEDFHPYMNSTSSEYGYYWPIKKSE